MMSHVLQCTQLLALIFSRRSPSSVRLHLVDRRRTEVLARVAVLGRAPVVADVGVGDDQVARLIFLVLGATGVKTSVTLSKVSVPSSASFAGDSGLATPP